MSEEILSKISEAVENAVDTKINGKLIGITAHLKNQDAMFEEQTIILEEVKKLLKERTFLIQLWAFIKFLGGIVISVGGAIVLYKKLHL